MSAFINENENTSENTENVKTTPLCVQNISNLTAIRNLVESSKDAFPSEIIRDGNHDEASQSCIYGKNDILTTDLKRYSDSEVKNVDKNSVSPSMQNVVKQPTPTHNINNSNASFDSCDSGLEKCSDTPTESEGERIARELMESERLAFALMQEETDRAYDMQMEFMRNNTNAISEEDLLAIQAAVGEPASRQIRQQTGVHILQNGDGEDDEVNSSSDSVHSDTSTGSSAWRDPNNYERLLALSSQIGDVKTERWRLRAKSVMDALPRIQFKEILQLCQPAMLSTDSNISHDEGLVANVTRHRKAEDHAAQYPDNNPRKRLCVRTVDSNCSVCMDPFIDAEDVQLTLLPCSHYLHDGCLRAWMSDHNSCPVCLAEISPV